MGRNIPMEETIISIHPVISSTLFVAWVIILVGIVSSLCGFWCKKGTESPNADDDKKSTTKNLESTAFSKSSVRQDGNSNDSESSMPFESHPSAATSVDNTVDGKKYRKTASLKVDSSSSTLQSYMSKNRKKKLTGSISMRLPSKIKGAPMKIIDAPVKIKDKASEMTRHKKTEEDTLWTKRIILGEKNRQHNEENSPRSSKRKGDYEMVDNEENGTMSSKNGDGEKGKLSCSKSMSVDCKKSSSSSSIERFLRTRDEKEYEMFSESSDEGHR